MPGRTSDRSSAVLWSLSAFGALSLAAGFAAYSLPRAAHQDFAQYYWAVVHHQGGGSLYDPTPVRGGINWIPPHFHLLIWPFVSLGSLELAYSAWTAFTFGCVGLVLWLSGASLGLATIAIWSAPVACLLTGQTAAAVALALTFAWRAAKARRSAQAGLWLATATLVKPFLAPLWLWPLLERQWKAFGVGAATATCSLALGAAVFGIDDSIRWTKQIESNIPWADHFLNSAIAALLAHGIHPASIPVWWLLAIAVVAFTAAVLVTTRRLDLDEAWLLLVMAGLLASPLAWIYYWVFLLPMLASCTRSRRHAWQLVLVVGALWPARLGLSGNASVYPVTLLLAWMMLALSMASQEPVWGANHRFSLSARRYLPTTE